MTRRDWIIAAMAGPALGLAFFPILNGLMLAAYIIGDMP